MSNKYEGLGNGTLYQIESRLRAEHRQVKYGDEGEQRNREIEHKLKLIKEEWVRRSDE